MPNKFVVGLRTLAIAIVLFAVGFGIYSWIVYDHVDNGYVGIVKHMDGSLTEIGTGWHKVGLTASMERYPAYIQGQKYTLTVGTSDSQKMPVQINITWQLNTKDADTVYRMVGGQPISYVQTNIVDQKVQGIVNQITHQYNWNDLLGKQMAEASDQAKAIVGPELAKNGIVLDSFYFGEVNAPASVAAAQQKVANAELGKETAIAAQNQAIIENQTKIMTATADASAAKIEASGTAAKAKALNEYVIEEEWVKQWHGDLSSTYVAGTSNSMFPGYPFTFNQAPTTSTTK
jgi:regulator of protease activity HflC (stomatin/prohibitin superfamily)